MNLASHPDARSRPNERMAELLSSDVDTRSTPIGYVDALPQESMPEPPGRAQAAWQTSRGSRFWQRLQPLIASWMAPAYQTVAQQLRLREGETVADVGCGPGNVTLRLADAVGPEGLAVGLDLSGPMLEQAVAQARPNMGLIRGDAERLPFRDGSVDAACATAAIMLCPDPARALAELVRVVAPGGWLLVMVPGQPGGALGPIARVVSRIGGARMFAPDDIPDMLDGLGCDRIHTRQQTNFIVVRARTSG